MAQPDVGRLERVAGAVYFVCFLLVLTTAVDYTLNVWPWRPSAAEWRYGAFGLLSGFLLTPLLAVAIALALAALNGQRGPALAAAIVSWVLAGGLVLGLGLFVLDALQVRSNVPADGRTAFDIGVGKAAFKHASGALAFVVTALAAGRLGRMLKPEPGRTPKPLVVGKNAPSKKASD